MADDIEKLRKSVRVNRIIIMITFLLILLLIAVIGVGGFYIYRLSQQMIPVARKFSEVDWTRMYDQITKVDPFDLKEEMDTIMADVATIKETLATFH